MSAEAEDIVVECDLPEPPGKVWRALTEPALVEEWLVDGDADIACEVLDAEPGRSVRYAWRDGGGVDSQVAFEISETADGGTHLRLVHSAVAAPVVMITPRRLRAPAPGARPRLARTQMRWAA